MHALESHWNGTVPSSSPRKSKKVRPIAATRTSLPKEDEKGTRKCASQSGRRVSVNAEPNPTFFLRVLLFEHFLTPELVVGGSVSLDGLGCPRT